MIGRLRHWLQHELWHRDLRSMPPVQAWSWATLRVVLHALSSFSRNLVGIQAAGLTMVSLLSLVPVTWLGFGVARVMGLDTELQARFRRWMTQRFEELDVGELPPSVVEMMENLQVSLEAVSLETLGLLGVLLLGYSGYSLFTKVERSINHVWLVHGQRSWYGRLGAFFALVVLVPPSVFTAILVEGLLHSSTVVEWMRENLPWLASLYDAGLSYLPLALLSLALTAVYKLMPAAKVRFAAAAGAGVTIALLMAVVHDLYFSFQTGASQYSPVYGVLASIPLLLIYLSLLWTLVLAGAQVSFAIQHVHTLRPPEDAPSLRARARRRLALLLMTDLIDRGDAPLDASERAKEWGLPVEWIEEVATDLIAADLAQRVEEPEAGLVATAAGAAAKVLEIVNSVDGELGPLEDLPLSEDLEARLQELEDARQRLLG